MSLFGGLEAVRIRACERRNTELLGKLLEAQERLNEARLLIIEAQALVKATAGWHIDAEAWMKKTQDTN